MRGFLTGIGGGDGTVAHVARVDDEDDGVADGVVGGPDVAERVLAADVPDLEVHVWEVEGGDVLADGWDGGFGGGQGVCCVWRRGGGGGGRVEGFEGVEERCFAGVVQAEEEDGVFCGGAVSLGEGWMDGWMEVEPEEGRGVPSFDVAHK